ncbi:hypothetical protein WME89_05080 [Sorangium sp. So ce321]|uniref:hypothetical protein n=1 Tax=Sorangium sp. So ce321 TaxID=3133300 RepID=UPI003F605301
MAGRQSVRDGTIRPRLGVIVGFRDCDEFRRKGMTCSEVMSIRFTVADAAGTHGRDERISSDMPERGASAMFELGSVW